MIVAPEAIAVWIGGDPHWPVVAAIARILTPGIIAADGARWQRRVRPHSAVRAPPQSDEAKAPARRGAVALALVGRDAAAADGDEQCPRPEPQPASGSRAGAAPQVQEAIRPRGVPLLVARAR